MFPGKMWRKVGRAVYNSLHLKVLNQLVIQSFNPSINESIGKRLVDQIPRSMELGSTEQSFNAQLEWQTDVMNWNEMMEK